MKKIFMAAMALVMLIGSTSCNKENVVDTETVKGQLVFNYTVGEKPGSVDTKALKSGWANGDQIMVVFWNNSSWKSTTPLVIEYNEGSWSTVATPDTEEWVVSSSMTYNAFHYRRVDAAQDLSAGSISNFSFQLLNIKGGEILEQSGDYTIIDGEVNLEIDLDYAENIFLVSIPDLSEADDWRLGILEGTSVPETFNEKAVSSHYPLSRYNDNIDSGTARQRAQQSSSGLYISSPNIAKQALARCVQNDGQITFAFWFDESKNTAADYTFFLSKGACSASNEKYIYSKNVAFAGKKAYKLPAITETAKWSTTTSYIAQ
jgi:hypothetical protein